MHKVTSKKILKALIVGTLAIGTGFTAQAIEQEPNNYQAEVKELSTAELEQLLAPIALYPDSLLTHILIASTYPLEVIEAQRWQEQYGDLDAADWEDKSENKDWDPSVKALLPFPTVLKKLSEELTWMQQLGDAFLEDEERVLASIQSLRSKADKAGNLDQMENVTVVREHKTIVIEPARTEVVYVPYYDTRVVYGNWHWAHHPPIYWHHPYHYTYYGGPFYWHSGIHISVGFYFTSFHWHKRHVVINRHHTRWHHPRRKVVTSHHAKKWVHSPSHRRGVAYRTERIAQKYHSNKVSSARVKNMRHHKHKAVKVTSHATHNGYREHSKINSRNIAHEKTLNTNKHRSVHNTLKRNQAVKVKSSANHREKQNKTIVKRNEMTTSRQLRSANTTKGRNTYSNNYKRSNNQSYTKVKQHKSKPSTVRATKSVKTRSSATTRRAGTTAKGQSRGKKHHH